MPSVSLTTFLWLWPVASVIFCAGWALYRRYGPRVWSR